MAQHGRKAPHLSEGKKNNSGMEELLLCIDDIMWEEWTNPGDDLSAVLHKGFQCLLLWKVELPPCGCWELSRPEEGGVLWSKTSPQSLPDGMQEYKVIWQIPVSNGQFLQCHEPR